MARSPSRSARSVRSSVQPGWALRPVESEPLIWTLHAERPVSLPGSRSGIQSALGCQPRTGRGGQMLASRELSMVRSGRRKSSARGIALTRHSSHSPGSWRHSQTDSNGPLSVPNCRILVSCADKLRHVAKSHADQGADSSALRPRGRLVSARSSCDQLALKAGHRRNRPEGIAAASPVPRAGFNRVTRCAGASRRGADSMEVCRPRHGSGTSSPRPACR